LLDGAARFAHFLIGPAAGHNGGAVLGKSQGNRSSETRSPADDNGDPPAEREPRSGHNTGNVLTENFHASTFRITGENKRAGG
jgi:hypothetical protein